MIFFSPAPTAARYAPCAVALLQEALVLGCLPACALLGDAYLEGIGFAQDQKKAFDLLMLCERHGILGRTASWANMT